MPFAAKLRARAVRRSRPLAAVLVGILVAVLTLYRVSLLPPSLHARALNVAAAATTIMVDTKQSATVDLGTRTDALEALATQTDLVGEVMVTDPVLAEIGRLANIDPLQIQATAPVTSNVPRTEIEPGSGANATALIAAPDQYKLQVQVDPTMPIIHVYAQAPSASAAVRLANASVQGLRIYLGQLSTSQTVSLDDQIELTQLGTVHGGVVNASASKEIGLLAFFTGFAGTLFALALVRRFRTGWGTAGLSAQAQQ